MNHHKEIRKQLRQVVQEILPEVIKEELFKEVSKLVDQRMDALVKDVKAALERIDERSKSLQSYTIRQNQSLKVK